MNFDRIVSIEKSMDSAISTAAMDIIHPFVAGGGNEIFWRERYVTAANGCRMVVRMQVRAAPKPQDVE